MKRNIPLVSNNNVDAINTSLISIKSSIEDVEKKAGEVDQVQDGLVVQGQINDFSMLELHCDSAANSEYKEVVLSGWNFDTLPPNELNISFTYGNTYGDTTASTPTYPKLRIKNANGNDIKTVDICDSRGHYAGTGCWNDGDLMSFKVIGNKALIQNSDIRQSTSDYHILSDDKREYFKNTVDEIICKHATQQVSMNALSWVDYGGGIYYTYFTPSVPKERIVSMNIGYFTSVSSTLLIPFFEHPYGSSVGFWSKGNPTSGWVQVHYLYI